VETKLKNRLPKEATQNDHVTYNRIPKSAIIKDNWKESIRKCQKPMGGNKERSDY